MPTTPRHPAILAYRQLYMPSPEPGTAQWLYTKYGQPHPSLQRVEILRQMQQSDSSINWQRRISEDNGKTWSPTEDLPDRVVETPAGGMLWKFLPPQCPLPDAGAFLPGMLRQWPGAPLWSYKTQDPMKKLVDHTFVVEPDGKRVLLKYEDGPDFDEADPFNEDFLNTNHAYLGNATAGAPDGTVFHPVVTTTRGGSIGRDGLVLFRRDPQTGDWLPSNRVPIDAELSSRGLLEPDVARLTDGRIIVIARGSSTDTTPGQKWLTISGDNGQTLSPIAPLRYDDGSTLYSPSSIHYLFRSWKTGKLYWLANISDTPEAAVRNGERYPLYLAEIDEASVTVKRDSLIMIDTRQPAEPAGPRGIQLSNFAFLDNRETGHLEVFCTLIGKDANDFWGSGCYRYEIALA